MDTKSSITPCARPHSLFRRFIMRQKIQSALGTKGALFLNLFVFIASIFISNLMLEYSAFSIYLSVKGYFAQFVFQYFLLGTATLGILFLLIFFLCNRLWLAGMIGSCISAILAVINFYVTKLHGAPLSFLILRNFSTALNVIHAYEIHIEQNVIFILCLLAICFGMCAAVGFFAPPVRLTGRKRFICNSLLCILSCLFFYFGYMGNDPIKPQKTISWLWREAYFRYGYVPCTVETYFQLSNIVSKPEGYSEEVVDNLSFPAQTAQEASAAPDIILILNETFYDPSVIVDLETDVPYLEKISTLENCLRGYAVIPGNGGGTNSSEYELLTSNSMELLPGVTPFNVLNLQGANSIVSHLSAQGYHTTGSHPEDRENYNRRVSYSALGFENIYFQNDFPDCDFYHDRLFETDHSVYQHMISFYENSPADVPRFQYLLTIQNHASWDLNDSAYDTVHAANDFGSNDAAVDEFLTGISQSDAAFYELTQYFSRQERPVIVCMLGDHGPAFAESIADPKLSEEDRNLLVRTVPLLIWANYPLEQQPLGTMSINYVVPTLLDIAGVKLNPYYRYQLRLKQDVPVLTSYGIYYDAAGNRYAYNSDAGAPYESAVNNYLYLEYNNLSDHRNPNWFRLDQ